MPYATNEDLPVSVQQHLPPQAQNIYRESFNHAHASHAGEETRTLGGGEAILRQGWRQLGRPFG
jgi:cation transport regulator ChaB